MQTNRRQFISRSAIGGLGLIAAPLLPLGSARAREPLIEPTVRPIVASMSRYYRLSPGDGARRDGHIWIQVDLGSARPIDAVRLRPAEAGVASGHRSPVRFCIDCSDDPAFEQRTPLVIWHAEHAGDQENFLARFPQEAVNARYVRLTASAEAPMTSAMLPPRLASIEILSGGTTMSATVRSWKANRRRGMSAALILTAFLKCDLDLSDNGTSLPVSRGR